jgi:hypothetical protein
MTGLLDGAAVPWDFVSGPTNPAIVPDRAVLDAVRRRRDEAAAAASRAVVAAQQVEPTQARRLVAAGRAVARDLGRQLSDNLRRLTTTEETS